MTIRIDQIMDKNWQQQLKARHPVLLKAHGDRRFRQPIAYYGIECGEGWYALIDELCTDIERALKRGSLPHAHVQQVKEKLGYLEFYVGMDEESSAIDLLIEKARERSAITCEKCGAAGVRRTDGWLIVLCDTHHKHRSWMEHA